MQATGTIIKKYDDLSFGCLSVKGVGEIFFNPNTEYLATDFVDLKVGQVVKVQYTHTLRGLLATSLQKLTNTPTKKIDPELGQ